MESCLDQTMAMLMVMSWVYLSAELMAMLTAMQLECLMVMGSVCSLAGSMAM